MNKSHKLQLEMHIPLLCASGGYSPLSPTHTDIRGVQNIQSLLYNNQLFALIYH